VRSGLCGLLEFQP